MTMELVKLATSREGRELMDTIRRLVASQDLTAQEVVRQAAGYIKRLETIAAERGMTVQEVVDESLDLYRFVK